MQKTNKSLTLEELASLTKATLVGDPAYRISGVNDLKSAKAEDASFLANPRYKDLVLQSEAGVICIHTDTPLPPSKNFLISSDPSRTFQEIAEHLLSFELPNLGFQGAHLRAQINESAKIDPSASIGAFTVVEKDASIGKNSIIYPHVYIGPGVQIGEECIIYPGVVIRERCIIENRVIIQPGAIIGSCGFGYTFDEKTGKFNKIEQIGIVRIEDDVEIGANTTIDRARFKETVIGKGTKIDNLVQIGHNVMIGENNAIVSQSGLAGSTKTGKNVLIGGQSGVVGHVEIADNVKIATRGGVSKSILKAGAYRGSPVMDMGEYNKQQVYLRKIERYVKKIEELEARVNSLESKETAKGIL